MRSIILLTTLTLIGTLTLPTHKAYAAGTNQQQPNAGSSGADTLTGCLKGSKNQYYVVEPNGTRHTVMAKEGQDLSSYVNHKVTLTGKASAARNAGGSSDAEGHRKGFFSIDGVSDEGACKK